MLTTRNRPDLNRAGYRPTWAEINLDALASNFQIVRKQVGGNVKIMAVVKADAYGHGAVICARRLAAEGADWFGVALPEEGIGLREAGITLPIFCLAGFWEGQAAACIQHKLVPAAYRIDMIDSLDQAARSAGVVGDVHIKIDTGMGRLGVRFDEIDEFVGALKRFQNIRVEGLMTHFAAADDPSCEPLTENQIRRFEQAVDAFRDQGYNPSHHHLANSAAIFSHPSAWGNMVRPGGVLYGLWRDVLPPSAKDTHLQPVMSVHSRITLLKWVPQGETLGYGCTYEASRKTLVATLPIGYEDGYLRGLSNRGHVIVRGSYAPVIGRVSMDLTLIDVTNIPSVSSDDIVTLLGEEFGEGSLTVPAEDIAKTADTLSYEVTCGISSRVPRLYGRWQ
jgi:alanine racemase